MNQGDKLKGHLSIQALKNDSDNFVVNRAFSFSSSLYPIDIIIKRGFISDGASSPMVLRGIVRGTHFRYLRAFIIHDALYRCAMNRYMSDRILDEALENLGMGWYTRLKIYYPLRLLGSPSTDSDLIDNAVQYTQILD